jgi:predicted transcriptional regulator
MVDVSRALKQLEDKGLIQVHRKPGSRSTVTVLFHPVHELIDAPVLEEGEV